MDEMKEKQPEAEVKENIVQDPSFLRWAINGDDVIEVLDAYFAGDKIIQMTTDDGRHVFVRIPHEEKDKPENQGMVFPEPILTPEGRNRLKSVLQPLVGKIAAMSEVSMQKIEEIVGNELEKVAVEFAMNHDKIFYDVSSFERVMQQIADVLLVSLMRAKGAGLRKAITERVQITTREEPERKGFRIPFLR